jgi:hypothetical protein
MGKNCPERSYYTNHRLLAARMLTEDNVQVGEVLQLGSMDSFSDLAGAKQPDETYRREQLMPSGGFGLTTPFRGKVPEANPVSPGLLAYRLYQGEAGAGLQSFAARLRRRLLRPYPRGVAFLLLMVVWLLAGCTGGLQAPTSYPSVDETQTPYPGPEATQTPYPGPATATTESTSTVTGTAGPSPTAGTPGTGTPTQAGPTRTPPGGLTPTPGGPRPTTAPTLPGIPLPTPGGSPLPPPAISTSTPIPTALFNQPGGSGLKDTPAPPGPPTETPTPTATVWALAGTPLPATLTAMTAQDAGSVSGLAVWQGQKATDLQWSPDGQLLAAASAKGVDLFDLVTRVKVRSLYPKAEGIVSIAFSPSRSFLVTGSRLGSERAGYTSSLERWFGPDLRPLGVFYNASLGLTRIAFTPDNQTMIAAYTSVGPQAYGQVDFWNTTGWVVTRTLSTGITTNLAISPDSRLLAAASNRYYINVWDLKKNSLAHRLPGVFNSAVNAMAFVPGKPWLVSGHADGQIILWDLVTGAQIRKFETGGIGPVESLAISPDGSLVATGSAYSDHLVRLWDVSSGAKLRELVGSQSGVIAVSFSPKGDFLASATYNGELWLWGLRP